MDFPGDIRCFLCLFLQISSLAMENKILIAKLQHTNRHPSVVVGHDDRGNDKEPIFSKNDLAAATHTNKEEITELSSAGYEVS